MVILARLWCTLIETFKVEELKIDSIITSKEQFMQEKLRDEQKEDKNRWTRKTRFTWFNEGNVETMIARKLRDMIKLVSFCYIAKLSNKVILWIWKILLPLIERLRFDMLNV